MSASDPQRGAPKILPESWSAIGGPVDLGVRPSRSRSEGDRLSVDERSALCLLALARNLLAADHKAVATLIDYAMVEVAQGLDREAPGPATVPALS